MRLRSGMSGSMADFFRQRLSVNHDGSCAPRTIRGSTVQRSILQRSILGSNVMTFAGRLSVITAYLAMAFVGAIVLGMI